MTLAKAIDDLLAYVEEHSERIHNGAEYAEFIRLDSCVYAEVHRAKLLDLLPEKSESGDGDCGRTHLPVIIMLGGVIPRTSTWKVQMKALCDLAEGGGTPGAGSEPDKMAVASDNAWSKAKPPTAWCKELGISATTLRRHVKEGMLVVDKVTRKLWCIRLDTLRRYKGEE